MGGTQPRRLHAAAPSSLPLQPQGQCPPPEGGGGEAGLPGSLASRPRSLRPPPSLGSTPPRPAPPRRRVRLRPPGRLFSPEALRLRPQQGPDRQLTEEVDAPLRDALCWRPSPTYRRQPARPEVRAEAVAQPRAAPNTCPAHCPLRPRPHGPALDGHPRLHQLPLPAAPRRAVPRPGPEPAARATQVSRSQTTLAAGAGNQGARGRPPSDPDPSPVPLAPGWGNPPPAAGAHPLDQGPAPGSKQPTSRARGSSFSACPPKACPLLDTGRADPSKGKVSCGRGGWRGLRPAHLPPPQGKG